MFMISCCSRSTAARSRAWASIARSRFSRSMSAALPFACHHLTYHQVMCIPKGLAITHRCRAIWSYVLCHQVATAICLMCQAFPNSCDVV